eukprot:ANDGO_03849.mRNA.1 hypothetical protein
MVETVRPWYLSVVIPLFLACFHLIVLYCYAHVQSTNSAFTSLFGATSGSESSQSAFNFSNLVHYSIYPNLMFWTVSLSFLTAFGGLPFSAFAVAEYCVEAISSSVLLIAMEALSRCNVTVSSSAGPVRCSVVMLKWFGMDPNASLDIAESSIPFVKTNMLLHGISKSGEKTDLHRRLFIMAEFTIFCAFFMYIMLNCSRTIQTIKKLLVIPGSGFQKYFVDCRAVTLRRRLFLDALIGWIVHSIVSTVSSQYLISSVDFYDSSGEPFYKIFGGRFLSIYNFSRFGVISFCLATFAKQPLVLLIGFLCLFGGFMVGLLACISGLLWATVVRPKDGPLFFIIRYLLLNGRAEDSWFGEVLSDASKIEHVPDTDISALLHALSQSALPWIAVLLLASACGAVFILYFSTRHFMTLMGCLSRFKHVRVPFLPGPPPIEFTNLEDVFVVKLYRVPNLDCLPDDVHFVMQASLPHVRSHEDFRNRIALMMPTSLKGSSFVISYLNQDYGMQMQVSESSSLDSCAASGDGEFSVYVLPAPSVR